jgi:hypothetical protein
MELASGAATASAVAAAISATFAGASSIGAWFTIRGRRPKLRVVTKVGNPTGGALMPDPEGDAISIRVANVRDTDIEVLDLWFETSLRRLHRLRRLPGPPRVWPPTGWFAEGAGQIPGTVRAHHTELYAFRTIDLGVALLTAGHGRYRPVVQCPGVRRAFRGDWFEVSAVLNDQAIEKREIS